MTDYSRDSLYVILSTPLNHKHAIFPERDSHVKPNRFPVIQEECYTAFMFDGGR